MKKPKIVSKLAASVMLLIVSLMLAMMGTYAWFTLSTAPEIGGMKVTIGGDDRVKIAADICRVITVGENENQRQVTVHYPGSFANSVSLNAGNTDALAGFGGLKPVSTVDGVHWYLPSYSLEDGTLDIASGTFTSSVSYTQDVKLSSANSGEGGYICLDFWVMAPSDYVLRLTAKDPSDISFSGGSYRDSGSYTYVVSLPDVVSSGSGGQTAWELADNGQAAAASVRVGVLASDATGSDWSLISYKGSEYGQDVKKLKGFYPELGETLIEDSLADAKLNFVLYEPNADLHPAGNAGSYYVTTPVAYDYGTESSPITTKLAAQLSSVWIKADETQPFSMVNTKLSNELTATLQAQQGAGGTVNAESLYNGLYKDRLQWQFKGVLTAGQFLASFQSFAQLMNDKARDGVISAEDFSEYLAINGVLGTTTADAQIIQLEANVPQRLRLFIWLEGMDADCTGAAAGHDVAIRLELAGGND